MQELLTMSMKELDRLRVIQMVLAGKLTWHEAAEQLKLSERQIGNVVARVRSDGARGLVHRLRGRPSNRRLPPGRLRRAVALVKRKYPDFGPTFATEKLRERHGLALSVPTLRRALIQAGLWRPRRQKARHRAWRPRRACVGMLIQVDGSEHDWFEGRGPRCVLLLYIDDATSRLLYGEFVTAEDTLTLMRTTTVYLKRYGRPLSFYVDQDSIYKINREASLEEQLRDVQPLTQFTRAMTELGIEVLTASSPQAKGRVERSFKTHQDRLVKELRLRGIATRAAANAFLWAHYLPAHNARYAQEPANSTDAHRPLLRTHDLARILCVRIERTLRADWTLRCRNQWFQLLPKQPVVLRPKDKLMVEFRLDGSTQLRAKGHRLAYTPLAQAPARRGGDGQKRGLGDAAAQSDAHTWPRNDDRRQGQGTGTPDKRPSGPSGAAPRLTPPTRSRHRKPPKPAPHHPWQKRLLVRAATTNPTSSPPT